MTALMNILVITDFFPHPFRPHEGIFVWEQVKELSKRHTIAVISPRMAYPPFRRYKTYRFPVRKIPGKEHKNGVPVFRPLYRQIPLVGEWFMPHWFFLKLLILVSKEGLAVDLVQAHWAYRAGWWAVLLGRLLRKPVIITVHGSDVNYWLDEPVKKKRIRWALRHASGVIFVSRKLADKVKSVKLKLRKQIVISNGIPSEKMRRSFVNENQVHPLKQIVFVGNLLPVKGADILLDALHHLKLQESGWCAVIGGDGPEREMLEQQSAALGLTSKVKFLGRLTNPEVLALLQSADVLVIPSRNEGAPLILLEALGHGTTVVSFDVGNVAEVLHGPNLGYVVKERTPEALAEAIQKALKQPVNPALAKKEAAKYLLENTVKQIEAFYRIAR